MKTLLIASLLCTAAAPAMAGTDPYIGEIMTFPYTFCPNGTLFANGAVLPIARYTALFSLLGTQYGGDGQQTFALPNLKPILTADRHTVIQCIAIQGVFPQRP